MPSPQVKEMPCIEGQEHEEGEELEDVGHYKGECYRDTYKCIHCGVRIEQLWFMDYIGKRYTKDDGTYMEDF